KLSVSTSPTTVRLVTNIDLIRVLNPHYLQSRAESSARLFCAHPPRFVAMIAIFQPPQSFRHSDFVIRPFPHS
ncbi:MAG: hypothetical protein QE570_01555, partial [Verrucomicrobiota bacterium]|nr:hypothetical protein [Verrucomicrobiota bacterium]